MLTLLKIKFFTTDDADTIATKIANAFNTNFIAANTNGSSVNLTVDSFDRATTDDRGDIPPGPFFIGGSTPGGTIRGTAIINNNTLWAVDDAGGVQGRQPLGDLATDLENLRCLQAAPF